QIQACVEDQVSDRPYKTSTRHLSHIGSAPVPITLVPDFNPLHASSLLRLTPELHYKCGWPDCQPWLW
ncbi:MAG: hypothetical protein ACPG77_17475, partial [Nannocystaceae bacterium]